MNFNQKHPSNNLFFWSKFMINSLIEMLELPNFGHITTSTIEFETRNKMLVTSWTKNMIS